MNINRSRNIAIVLFILSMIGLFFEMARSAEQVHLNVTIEVKDATFSKLDSLEKFMNKAGIVFTITVNTDYESPKLSPIPWWDNNPVIPDSTWKLNPFNCDTTTNMLRIKSTIEPSTLYINVDGKRYKAITNKKGKLEFVLEEE